MTGARRKVVLLRPLWIPHGQFYRWSPPLRGARAHAVLLCTQHLRCPPDVETSCEETLRPLGKFGNFCFFIVSKYPRWQSFLRNFLFNTVFKTVGPWTLGSNYVCIERERERDGFIYNKLVWKLSARAIWSGGQMFDLECFAAFYSFLQCP